MFQDVAKDVADSCIQGYNGTIFAYGQTGSGKTFTMQGPVTEESTSFNILRGIIPRSIEHIFLEIQEQERSSNVTFMIKCSFIEIYNECLYDLLTNLNNASNVCYLREDLKKGVYIENCVEEIVSTSEEALKLFLRGVSMRHVSATSMNHESSRSHAIFTLYISSKREESGIIDYRESRFNLVDLAGSERQGLTGTAGIRLKEAGNINKSLLALSNVINALAEISNGRSRHVHYRDSKLTFLLKDSLGGNSKTKLIANISPASNCLSESLSTLRFAHRVKQIKNNVSVISNTYLGCC